MDGVMIAMVAFITLMGAAIRLLHPLTSPAPLNDGGLFYTMIRDLQANGFALPTHTTYNGALIPFAYPPLAFYFTGWLASLSGWEVFDLLRILPPIFSTLTIPAFYLLCREMLRSKSETVIAVLIFAFIPRAMDWHVMGGGISRAPGFIFAILAIRGFYLLYTSRQITHIPLTILFSTLCTLTHPEATLHTALSAVVFYVLLDRTLIGLGRSILIATATVLLAAPWWGTVAAHHGILVFLAPVLAASQDSAGFAGRLLTLIGFKFTDELFLNIISILGLLGIAVTLVQRRYLLAAWLAIPYLIEPRGAALYIMLPHAMLAATAVLQLILPGLANLASASIQLTADGRSWVNDLLNGVGAKWVLGYIFLYGVMSAFVALNVVGGTFTLRQGDIDAFEWVRTNTSPASRFILLTHEVPLKDATAEWFPALAERTSLTTVFGQEWLRDDGFAAKTRAYVQVQSCSNQDETCLSKWSRQTGEDFEYVFIRKYDANLPVEPALAEHLDVADEYERVYESETVVIFRLLK